MEWAQRRKIYYTLVFSVGIISMVTLFTYLAFHKTPTCFDQKQNGDEAGIDCGGLCTRYCGAQVKPLRVIWAKAFSFAPGHYDVGAYIENPNINAGILGARYMVRIFGEGSEVLSERSGVIDIAPSAFVLVFEGNVNLQAVPSVVQIEFNKGDQERWVKAHPSGTVVLTKNQSLKNIDTKPRLEVTLFNTDLVDSAPQIVLGAIVYDSTNQPVAISRTFIDAIGKGSEYQTVFTWPNPFPSALPGEKFITRVVIMQSAVFE
ncbi:MAG: hypothetical protein HY228_01245 [Candidatus Yonathbacteria bacterium]|nr:hypothetical protein [Candidatus Yonathbacteria bacterium]